MWTYQAPVADMLHVMTRVLDAPATWSDTPDFDAILDGRPPYLGLDETRNHVRTVLALYESARRGERVYVEEINA